jgi:predicted metal-dependent hydrolase
LVVRWRPLSVVGTHDAAFWADLGRLVPDYEERQKRLRRVGGSFVW